MMEPAVLLRQAAALADDLRALTPVADRDVVEVCDWPVLTRVVLTGDGDSYYAARAAEPAFEELAGIDCDAVPAFLLLEHGMARIARAGAGRTLVVAISASGRTERVLEVVERAKRHGAATLTITGTAGSPVIAMADRAVVVSPADPEPSPGVRTYQASLLALLLLAARLGGHDIVADLLATAELVAATDAALREPAARLTAGLAGCPAVMIAGSGPNYGTALFAAAKVMEGTGVLGMGQDLEEWCHVEQFVRPVDLPVFVVSPPGRSHWRAAPMAERARSTGKRVIAVAHRDDADIARHADEVLAVPGDVREVYSPLVYHLFAAHLAAGLGHALGYRPYLGDLTATPREDA
jgi:glutamine---fructose-6-phosphate transaminase (isomerizing)